MNRIAGLLTTISKGDIANVLKLLTFYASLSSDWDYTHPKFGNNKILGTVTEATENYLIFKCEEPVKSDYISGNVLILKARHVGHKANSIDSPLSAGILYINNKIFRKFAKYAFIGNLEEC